MYDYNKNIETIKIEKINGIETPLYPKYLQNDGSIYYETEKFHDDCMINVFIMNIINDILRKGWIGRLDEYTMDLSGTSSENYKEVEQKIYETIRGFLLKSYNPRKAIISLLELLKYEINDKKVFDKDGNRIHFQITNSKKFTDLMVSLFSYDKINLLSNNKSISTSKTNVNDCFYNYIVMGYKINRCSKIKFDGYEFSNDWSMTEYESDSEENLGKELELIKKLPIEERINYLR